MTISAETQDLMTQVGQAILDATANDYREMDVQRRITQLDAMRGPLFAALRALVVAEKGSPEYSCGFGLAEGSTTAEAAKRTGKRVYVRLDPAEISFEDASAVVISVKGVHGADSYFEQGDYVFDEMTIEVEIEAPGYARV